MQHKIVVAITGASGSIYAKVLLDKLVQLNEQIASVRSEEPRLNSSHSRASRMPSSA